MSPGDPVTLTIGGRLYRGTVLYVRDGTVRVEVPGRKPVTRPIARVKRVEEPRIEWGAPIKRTEMSTKDAVEDMAAKGLWTSGGPAVQGYMHTDGTLWPLPEGVEVRPATKIHPLTITKVNHDTRTISVDLPGRVVSLDGAPLRPVPKPPKPWRSEAYRAFVRSQRSCCCCGGGPTSSDPMVAHHHGPRGMGEKACDSRCVPLLDSCHRHFHDHGVFYGVPVLQFAPLTREQTDRIALRAQAECLRAWCEREDIDTDEAIVDALVEAIRRTK